MIVFMVLLSFTNGGTLAFAEGNQATLIVVGDSQKKVILCPTVVNIDPNENAYDMLKKALGDKVTATASSFDGKPYVTGIDGLKEFDDGQQSGWLYEINGKSAQVGASDYLVKNNDVIAYRYTLDWGNDLQKQSVNDSIKAFGGCTNQSSSGSSDSSTQAPTKDPGQSVVPSSFDEALNKAITFTLNNGIQSDWQAIALTRAKNDVSSEMKNSYLQQLTDRVQTSGRLKGTYLASTILAINAVGGDATNIAGQNLVSKLYNDASIGDIYSYAYALLALDSNDYTIPNDALWNQDKLISAILKAQVTPGKWADDPDTNAMVLMALASHKDNPDVANAIKPAVDLLKGMQLPDGGFQSFNNENSNSAAVVVTALSMLGIDPNGSDFTKTNSALQNLITFQLSDGGFKWVSSDTANNSMSFDQAFYALVQYKYFLDGKGSIFHWTTAPTTPSNPGNNPSSSTDQPKSSDGQQIEQKQGQQEVQQVQQQQGQQADSKGNNESVQSQQGQTPVNNQPNKKLPDTGLIGNDFWGSIIVGLIFISGAMLALRNKVMR